jgi:hypothetical protein
MSCVEKQKSPDNKMTGSKVGIGPQLYLVNLQCGFNFLLEVFSTSFMFMVACQQSADVACKPNFLSCKGSSL